MRVVGDLVVRRDIGVGITRIAAVKHQFTHERQALPIAQIPIDADQFTGRRQTIIEPQDLRIAIVLYIALGARDRQKYDLGVAPLAVCLQVRRDLDPVIVGQRQLDLYALQVLRLHILKVEAAHIEFQQNTFFITGKEPPAFQHASFAQRQKANVAPP